MLILYIHGFLSAPQSFKAQLTRDFCQSRSDLEFVCPSLPAYPQQAMSILKEIVATHVDRGIGLIGSSLGGYYATYLSQHYRLPAVLVNPAVKPYELLHDYLHRDLKNYYSEESSYLNEGHTQELRDLEVNRLQYPALLWLLAQTGDETLDYRLAVDKYQTCKQSIEEGGDHSFQHFESHLPNIIDFLLATRD